MLVESVVTAKSVAIAASEAASNKIPYLGLSFFPEQKKSGIDLKWIKTHKGLSPILAPSNFDALPVLRARDGIQIDQTEMPFFREAMQVSERDLIEIGRVEDETDPYLASALRSIYDDSTKLIESAEVVGEVMRMQLLSAVGGHPSINIAADGVSYAYNYDPNGTYAANNYQALSGTSQWSNPTTATPIDDLNNAKKALAANGYNADIAIINSTTFGLLRACDQVKAVAMSTNAAGVVYMSDAIVLQIIKDTTGLDLVIYDKVYDNAGTATKFYPDNQVTLLPNADIGKTWFGTTPAERSIGQVTNATTTIYGTGITITAEPEIKNGVYRFVTTASEIVLPSFELMDATYVIKVA